ncbi:MAG TPA: 50S ribosomal protein L29 [Desulfohalobiaceae bacterium]|nr:50S ribosomal protein L29 [Desulfohalobiaceae bacterium]
MNKKDLRELSINELHSKLADFRKEHFNLRFQQATGQLENTQRLPKVKKTIARILTFMREKELEQNNA